MQIDPRRAVGFSGHRPDTLGASYDIDRDPVWLKVRSAVWSELYGAVQCGYDTFISGMALGFDQVVAEEVIRLRHRMPDLGIKLVAAVPFVGQEGRWPFESRVRYTQLLLQADDVVTVSPGGFANWKMGVRNQFIVDNSALMVALWNGVEAGGTYNCVRYARQVGREVVVLSPAELLKEVS